MNLYRYIRLTVTRRRSSDGYVQLSDIRFVDKNGGFLQYPSGATVKTSISPTGSGESGINLIDNNTDTKFCASWNGSTPFTITIDLGKFIDFDNYPKWQYYTANDSYFRDPTSFTLALSVDGTNYSDVDSVTSANITSTRQALGYEGTLNLPESGYGMGILLSDSSDKIYTLNEDGELEEVVLTYGLNADVFIEKGIRDYPPGSVLMELDEPKVYLWTSDGTPNIIATIMADSFPQVLITKVDLSPEYIVGIKDIVAEASDNVKVSYSYDGDTYTKEILASELPEIDMEELFNGLYGNRQLFFKFKLSENDSLTSFTMEFKRRGIH